MPLFEAIANSFNAIQEAQEKKGKITITIVREKKQQALSTKGKGKAERLPTHEQVTGCIVEDNGGGFNDANLKSFKEAYSDFKQASGGKGIGRILWLKAFESAQVNSVYEEGGKRWQRTFPFALDNDTEPDTKETIDKRKTTVELVHYRPDYKKHCPTGFNTIARRIIAHFIESFILDSCPEIWLKDDSNNVSLNRYFKNELRLDSKQTTFALNGHKFKVEHLCLAALPETTHEIHCCAGIPARSVTTTELRELIPALRQNLVHKSGKQFVYAAYVSGKPLEDNLDEFRSRFDIPDEKSVLGQNQELTWQGILRKVAESSDEFLHDYLKPVRDKNNSRIKQYIVDHEPKYRPLAKHRPQWFDRIAPGLNDDDLSIELYKLSKEYDIELLKARPKITAAQKAVTGSIAAHKEKFKAFLREWNDQGMSKLADYIIHRKSTLEFFDESLRLMPTDRYAAESQIHTIICPMRSTSDDVPAEQMNLWIIDERLTYHAYLASDKEMKSLEPVSTDSTQRPDLILFNCALAFTDKDFSSIVIVEFKRPMRTEYEDNENPIQQVLDYIDTLRLGNPKPLDHSGRPMKILETTPFYAFIVCDITPKLERYMRQHDFVGAADEGTYYKYIGQKYNVFIHVISFNRLSDDSKKRNQVFFDKLRLHFEVQEELETPASAAAGVAAELGEPTSNDPTAKPQ